MRKVVCRLFLSLSGWKFAILFNLLFQALHFSTEVIFLRGFFFLIMLQRLTDLLLSILLELNKLLGGC